MTQDTYRAAGLPVVSAQLAGEEKEERRVTTSIAHAWAVLDAAPAVAGLRAELQELVAGSLAASAVPEVGVVPGGEPGRLVLAFAPETPPDVVDGPFLADLCDRLAGTGVAQRLTVALHSGAFADSFAHAACIADAPVLARVAAAAHWSPVVLAASEEWHEEAGWTGATRVRCGGETFWIRVPGASTVPGLVPSDVAPSSRPVAGSRARSRSGGRSVNVEVRGSVHGDQVAGDKIVHGGTRYGSDGIRWSR